MTNAIAFGMWFREDGVYPGHNSDERMPIRSLERGMHVLAETLGDLATSPAASHEPLASASAPTLTARGVKHLRRVREGGGAPSVGGDGQSQVSLVPGVHLGAPAGAGPDAAPAAFELAAGTDPVDQERRLSVAPHHLDARGRPRRLEADEATARVRREGAPEGPRTAAGGALEEPATAIGTDVGPGGVGGPDELAPGVPVGLLVHRAVRVHRHEGLRRRADDRPVEDAVLRSSLAGEEGQRCGGSGDERGPAHDATVSQPGAGRVKQRAAAGQGLAAAPPGGMSRSRSRPSRRSGMGVWVAPRRLPCRIEYTWVNSAPRYRISDE